MNVDDLIYGFACPQVGINEPFLKMLVVEHARQASKVFLTRYSGRLKGSGGDLVGVLSNWLSRDETLATVWDMSVGEVYGTLLLNDADNVVHCAAALGLRLHECGYSGEWEVQLNTPARFRFGRWLLPPTDAIRVSASARTASVWLSSHQLGQQYAFHRVEEDWNGPPSCELPMVNQNGIRLRVFDGTSLTQAGMRLLQRLDLAEMYNFNGAEAEVTTLSSLSACHAAVGLIGECSDLYLGWVARVLTDLISLPPHPGIVYSGSDKISSGAICLSHLDDRCALAELLVHEATHQYFYILNRFGPVDDGSDTTLYFSPFKRAHRPIGLILLAYHAFGNVLLFYRAARAYARDATERASMDLRLKLLEEQLDILDQALRASKALTAIGRALWEPVCQQIHS